jgi:hypothetical protein
MPTLGRAVSRMHSTIGDSSRPSGTSRTADERGRSPRQIPRCEIDHAATRPGIGNQLALDDLRARVNHHAQRLRVPQIPPKRCSARRRSHPPSYRSNLLLLFANCDLAPAIGKVHGNGNQQYVEYVNHDRLVTDR